MKLSFEEDYRLAICTLGEFSSVPHLDYSSAHLKGQQCMRRKVTRSLFFPLLPQKKADILH